MIRFAGSDGEDVARAEDFCTRMGYESTVGARIFLGQATDAEPTDTGPTDAGPTDAEPPDADPVDTGPVDTGPVELCGDGVLQAGEACDDMNQVAGDGCN